MLNINSTEVRQCPSNLTAKIVIGSADGSNVVLHAFLPMIKLTVGDETLTGTSNGEDILSSLLMADKFNVTYSK